MFGFGVVEMGEERRLTLPTEVISKLTWLKDETPQGSVPCVALYGASGGIQIAPKNGDLFRKMETLDKRLNLQPRDDESSASWMRAIRLYATTWDVVVQRHGTKARLTVPSAIGDLGVLRTGHKSQIAVFCAGATLEIWDADKWHVHIQGLAASRTELTQEAEDRLARRQDEAE